MVEPRRETTVHEYLRVTPTSERLEPESIPRVLDSLHKLTTAGSSGLGEKLNPLHSDTPPRFEFLALSDGPDNPVEFFYGADEHLDTLEKRLRSIYPATFDIERVELDVASRLIQLVEFTKSEFIDLYEAGQLQYDFGPDDQYDLVDENAEDTEGTETTEADPFVDGGTAIDPSTDHYVDVGDTALKLAPPSAIPTDDPLRSLTKPTMTTEGTILARPATDAVSPLGVRWCGSAARKQDWMTSVTPFTAGDTDSELASVDQPGAALASLIDHLMEATAPVAFQAVFQRRESWHSDAEVRKEDLVDGRDTFFQEVVGSFLEVKDQRNDHDDQQLSESISKRIEYIDAKNPKRSFTANIRAIGVPTDDSRDDLNSRMESLLPVFDPLDGPFYEVEGKRLRDSGFREKTKAKNARAALQRLFDRELKTGRGKTCPEFVLGGRELANFLLVPSSEQLTVEGTRGTRAEQQSRNPLPRPHQDLMAEFREGMAIGRAIDETGDPEDVPTRLPPPLLPTHYGRFGTTGSGKSKALINDLLSLYATTDGPTILIDPKGDGMAENYMRAHAAQFGIDDLEENVIHFPLPEILPGFSFFNLEPAMANGRRREDAVQRKADHYEEILKLVMGTERYERATVAPGLIKTLIKALFDEEHGRENGQYRESEDYFAHRQLEHAVDQLWEAGPPQPNLGAAPQSSDEEVIRSLRRQLQADPNTFSNVMGGVGNRLSDISQDTHLRRIFNNTENQFDFRDVLDEQTVILFDLGDLRDEAARIMTGVILTNLEDALQEQNQDASERPEDYVVNLLIDEAASVAVSDIMNNLLEQGRSFRLSVGLSMQFPEQMEAEGGRKAYLNVLNNIGSPLVGKINVDRELAQAMAHEDMDTAEFANRIRSLPRGEWIANLPSPRFGETGPYPFSLDPLSIPAGHPESEQPFTDREEARFNEALTAIRDRADETFGVTSSADPPETETPEEFGEMLDVTDGELDVAITKVVRSVQLRTEAREENKWVAVEAVDDELQRLFEDVDAAAPSYDELSNIRQRSRFLDTTVDVETDELVIRLTEEGEAVATPDTGGVQAAGSHKHNTALEQIEEELTTLGFTASILMQDGSEMPDARATHTDLAETFAIEVETTTPGKPAKVLTNLRKAQEADEVPIFVVRPDDSETYWAKRVEQTLESPVRELQSGDTRFYTTDSNITFNGGATEEGGVTAVRPTTTDGGTQNIWKQENGKIVLEDADGTEHIRVGTLDDLSKDRMPAVCSYDPTAGEYVVYAHGDQRVYASKEAFDEDWTRIKRPFVPEDALPYPEFGEEQYAIVILHDEGESVIYRDDETEPLGTLPDFDLSIAPGEGEASVDDGISETLSKDSVNVEDERSDERADMRSAWEDNPNAAIGYFASEYLREVPDASERTARVYDVYETWAKEQGLSPDSKSWFARRLSNHVEFESTVAKQDGETTRYYKGIEFAEDH